MCQPAIGAALKVIKDLELFEKWHERGDGAMRGDQLAEIVSCDPLLLGKFPMSHVLASSYLSVYLGLHHIEAHTCVNEAKNDNTVRLLRHLTANHMLQEPSPGVFKPTSFTFALLEPIFGEWINLLCASSHPQKALNANSQSSYDVMIPCFHTMPSYLAKASYQTPTDPTNGIFQSTKGWEGDLFQYFAAHPREGHTFNQSMGGVMAQQASWLDIFPYYTLLDSSDPTLPFLVDVGGNIGHDMEKFRHVHPEMAVQLYLEDRPEVIQRSLCPDPVNKIAYDFFTPQPITGE